METDIITYMRRTLEDQRKNVAEVMMSGRAISFEDYKYMCGQINSLEFFSSVVDEIEKKLLDE